VFERRVVKEEMWKLEWCRMFTSEMQVQLCAEPSAKIIEQEVMELFSGRH
jgi:hypothetical protein